MSNDISKAGFTATLRPPVGDNISKMNVVAVMRLPSRNEVSKFGAVVVIRGTGSTRRRMSLM